MTLWRGLPPQKARVSSRQFSYSLPVEIVSVVLPTIIVAAIFSYTVVVQNDVDKHITNPDVKIDVTASQWNWKFDYPDNPTGRPDHHAGHQRSDPIWCWPTDRTISSPGLPRTSSTPSSCRSSCSSGDVFPDPENTTRTTCSSSTGSSGRVRFVAGAPSCAAATTPR